MILISISLSLFQLLAGLLPQLADLQAKTQFFRTMAADNQKAIAAVKTLSCQFQTINMIPQNGYPYYDSPTEGYYRLKGKTFRSKYQETYNSYQTQNYIFRDGIGIRLIERSKSKERYTLQSKKADVSGDLGDVMFRLLVHHHITDEKDVGWYTLDKIRAMPHRVVKADIQKNDQLETDHLQLVMSYGTLDFWLDTNSHGWIRKMTYLPKYNNAQLQEREVLEFFRSNDGAVIPSLVSNKTYENGTLISHLQTKLTDIKLNEPMDDKELMIPVLAGMMCSDLDKKMRYIVDEWGKPAGPEMLDPDQMDLPAPQPIYPAFEKKNPMTKDSLSGADVIAIVFVTSLVLIGSVWMVRSNRQARRHAAINASLPANHRPNSRQVRR